MLLLNAARDTLQERYGAKNFEMHNKGGRTTKGGKTGSSEPSLSCLRWKEILERWFNPLVAPPPLIVREGIWSVEAAKSIVNYRSSSMLLRLPQEERTIAKKLKGWLLFFAPSRAFVRNGRTKGMEEEKALDKKHEDTFESFLLRPFSILRGLARDEISSELRFHGGWRGI